jgi:hypothetical protein
MCRRLSRPASRNVALRGMQAGERMSYQAQRERLLDLLMSHHGQEVSLPEVMQCAAQYNARIFELRRMGWNIPAPRRQMVNGELHTWYRLLPGKWPGVATVSGPLLKNQSDSSSGPIGPNEKIQPATASLFSNTDIQRRALDFETGARRAR